MIKKYLLGLFIVFSATFSFAAPKPYAHFLLYDDINKDFFKKFISGQEATYMVCVEEYTNGKQLKDEVAQNIFSEALNNWLDKTKYYITEDKKRNTNKEEFKDILKIVEAKELLKQVPCSVEEDGRVNLTADLTVLYKLDASEYCDEAVACFLPDHSVLIVSTLMQSTPKEYTKFITHELGHTWGLADQYSGAIYDGSFLYNSKVLRPSIMNKSQKVTCDDVDAFITSIDRTLGNKREFNSLCNDGIIINNGQAIMKDNQSYNFKENYEYFDAEIKVSYDTEFKDFFILDMTLNNFILSQEGIDLIQEMGFNVTDLKTLKNAEVKIHGRAFEMMTEDFEDIYLRTPDGLWTFVLYNKRGKKAEPKQVITKEFFSMEDVPTFTDLETNYSYLLFKNITVPLINFLPSMGQGRKENLRRKFSFKIFNFESAIENNLNKELDNNIAPYETF